MNTSYWLPDGSIIFPTIFGQSEYSTLWAVGIREKRGDENAFIHKYRPLTRKRFFSQEDCMRFLAEYAKKKGLKPAY